MSAVSSTVMERAQSDRAVIDMNLASSDPGAPRNPFTDWVEGAQPGAERLLNVGAK